MRGVALLCVLVAVVAAAAAAERASLSAPDGKNGARPSLEEGLGI